MVESPTYYHSLSPVLRSLKEFDMENFPLQAEVIYSKPAQEIPGYLKDARFQTAIVSSSKKAKRTTDESQNNRREEGDSSNNVEASEERDTEEFETINTQSLGSSCAIDLDRELDLDSLLGRSTSSVSLSKFVDTLPDFCPEEKMNAKPEQKEVHEEYKNTDNCVFTCMAFIGGVDPSEIEGAHPNDNHIPENIEPQDTDSQEKLGGRMNVERFLEIFNSSSQSSLEASQCDALVHALKNRLAVIQGE